MAKHRHRMNKFKTSPPSASKIRRHEAESHALIQSGFSITSIHRDLQIGKGICYYSELTSEGKPSISRWLTKGTLGPYAPALLENYTNEKLANLLERRRANQTGAQDPSCSSYDHPSAENDLYLDLKSKGYSIRKIFDYRGITFARQYRTRLGREEDSETADVWISRKMFVTDYEKLMLFEFNKRNQRKDKPPEPSEFVKKQGKEKTSEPPEDPNVNDSTSTLVRDKRFKSGFRPVQSNEMPSENRPASKGHETKSREIGVQVDLISSPRCENCEQPKKLEESTTQTSLTYFLFDSVYCSK